MYIIDEEVFGADIGNSEILNGVDNVIELKKFLVNLQAKLLESQNEFSSGGYVDGENFLECENFRKCQTLIDLINEDLDKILTEFSDYITVKNNPGSQRGII